MAGASQPLVVFPLAVSCGAQPPTLFREIHVFLLQEGCSQCVYSVVFMLRSNRHQDEANA